MDHSLFFFLEILAFFWFIYGIERDSWQGLLIFLSAALFLALSLASFDIEKTYVFFNETSGETITTTTQQYSETYGYLNSTMALLSIALGMIKTIHYKSSLNSDTETD